MKFSNIVFGKPSAEEEIFSDLSFVTEKFYEFKNCIKDIIKGNKFIILGNKGSGKSIIGEHLNNLFKFEEDEYQLFTRKLEMKNFPYKSFSKIIPGGEDAENKISTAWKWTLLIYIIASFKDDNGIISESDPEITNAFKIFSELGILPTTELKDITKRIKDREFKLKIYELELSGKRAEANNFDLAHMPSHLITLTSRLQSPNKHLIIIDGLDNRLGAQNKQNLIISSLICEAEDINRTLAQKNVPAKIVILCREDIFSKLPGSNKNKLRGYSINLNWYEDQIDPKNKNIVKLAQFRAEKSGYVGNLFEDNFEKEYSGRNCLEYLLENTRYTPRDFLTLLETIKEVRIKNKKISVDEISQAVKKYSVEYFWPEIEDELDMYVPREKIGELKKALNHFSKKKFHLTEFESFCEKNEYDLSNIKIIFETLYNCGAISHIQDLSDGSPGYSSKTRDGQDFNHRKVIVIHRAIWKALSL